MKKALVTLAVGPNYRERWERLCRKTWIAYCERHRYDLILLDTALDTSERARCRSPAWQKCLILEPSVAADYDRVVWVDSDVFINPAAPCIAQSVPVEKIGAVDEFAFPTPEKRQKIIRWLAESARRNPPPVATAEYWEKWLQAGTWHAAFPGLPANQHHIVQTGVMVLSPRYHRELLHHVYEAYADAGQPEMNYEMRPLSHEIQAHGLCHWIDSRFNALTVWLIWQATIEHGREPTHFERHYFLLNHYLLNHFLHFAGMGNVMGDLAVLGA